MSKTIKSWKDIKLSEEANNVLAKLEQGVTIALRMRHVNNSDPSLEKVQIEFAEKISNGRPLAAAALFNADDDRFSSGAQRAWETASLTIAEQMFGKIPDGEASVEILKKLLPENGQQLRMQLTECLESELNETELQYSENYLKRAGSDGNYFYTPNGDRVASRKRMIVVKEGEQPKNTFLDGQFSEEPGDIKDVMTGSKPAIHADVMGS